MAVSSLRKAHFFIFGRGAVGLGKGESEKVFQAGRARPPPCFLRVKKIDGCCGCWPAKGPCHFIYDLLFFLILFYLFLILFFFLLICLLVSSSIYSTAIFLFFIIFCLSLLSFFIFFVSFFSLLSFFSLFSTLSFFSPSLCDFQDSRFQDFNLPL